MATSIGLAGDLKMGQYLKVSVVSYVKHRLRYSSFSGKIPPRAMFTSQIYGTIIGMSPNEQR